MLSRFSRVRLFLTSWTTTCPRRARLSMRFSRQEYWSGLPFPSPATPICTYFMHTFIYKFKKCKNFIKQYSLYVILSDIFIAFYLKKKTLSWQLSDFTTANESGARVWKRYSNPILQQSHWSSQFVFKVPFWKIITLHIQHGRTHN